MAMSEDRREGDGSLDANRAYYDEFSKSYEHHRRPNDGDGYHALVDDLEVELCARYASGREILECGCGTGLILERLAGFAQRAAGIDLSPGMLELARARGLDVREGSVTELPFEDASFDVTCSFKVLAHVRDIGRALAELARVTRPGGVVLAEFYNPLSFRGLAKRLGPAGKISDRTRESAVYTRFDAPWVLPRILPPGTRIEASRGIRIVTPAAAAMRLPGIRGMLRRAERLLCDSPAAVLGGFYVAVIRKAGG
jgi:ubiquinone/menaquinone biosynthesis C-methylase UbiE